MRIRASTRRKKGGLFDGEEDSVGSISLSAESDSDRKFITSIFRVLGDPNRERQDAGVAWLREYLKSFPPFG